MTPTPPTIGIAVTANNIDPSTISRFLDSARKSLGSKDKIAVSNAPTFGPYNKSRHLNDCLRILIGKGCDLIVQTDIDIEFSKDLVEQTRLLTVEGTHLWSPCIKNAEIWWPGSGSWNALRTTDWIKVGGFDERFFEWGSEDEDLHYRCRDLEFRRLLGKPHPNHRNHPKRSNWSPTPTPKKETRDRNASLSMEKNPINYLTDSLSPSRGITLHLTSRCARKCPECCLQDFLAEDPDYFMTERDIDDFVRALELSPIDAERVILCGGEPLLCPTLSYAIKKLNHCKTVKGIALYTGLVEGFDLASLPPMKHGSIRVSRYGSNDRLIKEAERQGHRLTVTDKLFHIKMPDKLHPETIPGICYNPEVFIYKGRVYTCPMVAQNLIRHNLAPLDSPLYSEPLTNRFFERTRGWKTGAMTTCSGCAGNTYLKRITGSYRNDKD